ncbi:MAG: hypothetical protein WDN67_03465 [Candidatus Moraniibacteriota bacterium]
MLKNLELLASLNPDKHLLLGRELTKIFESFQEGSVDEVLDFFLEHPEQVKGEFVVLVS